MPSKKKIKNYYVRIQFEVFDARVKACSGKEAKEKVYAKLQRRKISKLVDKKNTYVDLDD